MFFLAATLVGWIGGDFVYRKLAANSLHISATASSNCNQVNSRLFAREDFIPGPHISGNLRTRARRSDHFSRYASTGDMLKILSCKVGEKQDSRRYQIPPPVRCCPQWVNLSIRRGVRSVLLHTESLLRRLFLENRGQYAQTWRHP